MSFNTPIQVIFTKGIVNLPTLFTFSALILKNGIGAPIMTFQNQLIVNQQMLFIYLLANHAVFNMLVKHASLCYLNVYLPIVVRQKT